MKLLTLTFILFTTQFAQAKNNCWIYLAENKGIEASNSVTDNFIAFLNVMLKENVIDDIYLAKLVKGEFANPLKKESIVQSEHQIYNDVFQDFVLSQFDKNKVTDWAKTALEARRSTQQSKEQAKEQNKDSYFKMEFHPIKAGSYVFNKHLKDKKPYNITLTEDFEMMSTSVTQRMWKDVMGSLPKQSYEGDDYPIDNINWWSMLAYANELSKKNNLPEVYNFNTITTGWDGSPAEGNWIPKDYSIATEQLTINAPNNDIYLAKGYRLPTIYEYVFVASDRGRSNTKAFTDLEDENLKPYVYCDIKGDLSMRTVAEGLPFLIDGKKFYDLYGNAYEVSYDIGTFDEEINGGTNPVHTKAEKPQRDRNFYRLMRGSGGSTGYNGMTAAHFGVHDSTIQFSTVSFRLVRSLPK